MANLKHHNDPDAIIPAFGVLALLSGLAVGAAVVLIMWVLFTVLGF